MRPRGGVVDDGHKKTESKVEGPAQVEAKVPKQQENKDEKTAERKYTVDDVCEYIKNVIDANVFQTSQAFEKRVKATPWAGTRKPTPLEKFGLLVKKHTTSFLDDALATQFELAFERKNLRTVINATKKAADKLTEGINQEILKLQKANPGSDKPREYYRQQVVDNYVKKQPIREQIFFRLHETLSDFLTVTGDEEQPQAINKLMLDLRTEFKKIAGLNIKLADDKLEASQKEENETLDRDQRTSSGP